MGKCCVDNLVLDKGSALTVGGLSVENIQGRMFRNFLNEERLRICGEYMTFLLFLIQFSHTILILKNSTSSQPELNLTAILIN